MNKNQNILKRFWRMSGKGYEVGMYIDKIIKRATEVLERYPEDNEDIQTAMGHDWEEKV